MDGFQIVSGRRLSDGFARVDARSEAMYHGAVGPGPRRDAAPSTQQALSDTALLGVHIAGFRVDRLLCNRGLGAVYEGVQEWPPRSVVIKLSHLDCSPDMARIYERRCKTVQALHHPRIAGTYSSGIEQWAGRKVPFQVMEHVANAIPLRRYAVSRQLSVPEILSLFREVCEAVAAGHQQGVFHGYLTPHKVLIDPSGSPKVVDYCNFLSAFGGCESTLPATGSKPSRVDLWYMSPEQYVLPASAIDARADVYSLGAILYELLTGLPPYDVGGRSISEARDLIRRARPMSPRRCNTRITPAMASILADCLKKNRDERLASAEELAFALDDVVSDRLHRVRKASGRGLVHTSHFKRLWMAFAAGVLKTQTKVQPSLSWMARQIVSVARRNQSIALKFTLPWISLLVVGWVFFWVVAEIAREALGPSPVEIDARRTTTQLSPPPSEEESGLAGDSPAGGISVP
jgi:serine/threonine protein kinase